MLKWRKGLGVFFNIVLLLLVAGVFGFPNISSIPRGNGDGRISGDELFSGRWKFNSFGRSFTTYLYTLPSNADRDGTCLNDKYLVRVGRSNLGANTRVINDFPKNLGTDLGVSNISGIRVNKFFVDVPVRGVVKEGRAGSSWSSEVAAFDSDRDGDYEGWARSPLLAYGGKGLLEGGDFLSNEIVSVKARTAKGSRFILDIDENGVSDFVLPLSCERDVILQFEVTTVQLYLNTPYRKKTP